MKVNDSIFYLPKSRNKPYGDIATATITKVGRLYFDTDVQKRIRCDTMQVGHPSDDGHYHFFSTKA